MYGPDHITTDQLPGRTLSINGAEYLFCSGTSYLGISCNEAFRQCLLDGMQRYGTNYSSSRNSNLQLQVFDEVENYLAAYTGAAAALTMSSGYLAGQVVVQALKDEGRFLYAPGTHPAMWRSMADAPDDGRTHVEWVNQLLQEAPRLPDEHLILVCNSLDPLKAEKYTFDWVAALPDNKQITLIVDDSHGFGVTGDNGAGVYRQLRQLQSIRKMRLVVISSFGKAFGIPAGLILADSPFIEQLKSSPYFGGASPAVPAYLYAFLHSKSIFEEARQKLLANILYFRQRLACPELFSSFEDYPVFYTSSEALCPYLLQHRVFISSFRYPTPADAPITRVILNALHTPEDLNRLAALINQFKEKDTSIKT
ncbi:pyridoxal phosphate-dependent aminotransferase family protein [Pontibacter sp. 172403-2]|uniref:aminotransferase class I/II-fold pyridoxal phosphate-dependent enzyme n=1 Tax=Pontibacter rufus TaxID=2791028 RepID=UPI0018B003AA|nr:aminotransferase class I/II-fold pyridoxal phosphate-dependent enzyme [Pontibacter sp. 172403-2]MBF9251972.1 pyridoxal phosphate-dependent aminotransferase family protein [Pontibacter sp. 172403-2]